ncbi:MAG TPA: family 16 glycoside hydrolase [Fodinibius sp.]|nr:family 16 glycoside hydrolase [Fodinibius sp.]
MLRKLLEGSIVKQGWFVVLILMLPLIQSFSTQPESEQLQMEALPMNSIELNDLEAFQHVAGNWQVAEKIESNRRIEHDLWASEGNGILVNIPTEENNGHIFTQWEHNDLDLELDFLMPRGSNAGIYLMGRYEVQLLDSWGVENPTFSDVGGIYQRWDESRPEGEKGYEGHPPLRNAARAPGLWQHIKISFKGPEFNDAGEKITNACFKEVWLNGILVQEDVEVTGPTRAAAFDTEQPLGPLMIQGDHGPVAIRNIKYKKYDKTSIALTNLSYEYYEGAFDELPNFDTLTVSKSGTVDSLAGDAVEEAANRYAMRYSGTLEAPNSGTYLFNVRNAGVVRMLIDGKPIFDQDTAYQMDHITSKTIDLEDGVHDFVLEYINHPEGGASGLSLEAEGPRLRLQNLHASSSVSDNGEELPDLIIEPKEHIKIIRSFKEYKNSKRTHVVNVGSPNGINYSYDMGQAALLDIWNGPFLNVNKMWVNRGEPQTATSGVEPLELKGSPPMAILNNKSGVWPDSISRDNLKIEGYKISKNGWPVFNYSIDDVTVKEKIECIAIPRHLVITIQLDASKRLGNMWYQLASGEEITQNDEGEYIIDDRNYYLKINDMGGIKPQIIYAGDEYSLRLPVLAKENKMAIQYEIIW